jgi:hypothetical protein
MSRVHSQKKKKRASIGQQPSYRHVASDISHRQLPVPEPSHTGKHKTRSKGVQSLVAAQSLGSAEPPPKFVQPL